MAPKPIPPVIDRQVRIAAGTRLNVDGIVRVVEGGSLELEGDTVLAFGLGAALVAEGGAIVAHGEIHHPIVFTSSASQPQPGDWIGVIFTGPSKRLDRQPLPVSVLEHVVVEYAGGEQTFDPALARGGVSIIERQHFTSGEARRHWSFGTDVALRHILLRRNAQQGLYIDRSLHISDLSHVMFGPNGGVSARVPAQLVGALGSEVPEAVVVEGVVQQSISLPKLPVSYLFDHVVVSADHQDVTLTIAEGATVRFLEDAGLEIEGNPYQAKLVAHRVTFTSAAQNPAPGSWRGLSLRGRAGADLNESVFEYTGSPWRYGLRDTHAAIAIDGDDQQVRITRSIFRYMSGAAIEGGECRKWRGLGNVVHGQPLCLKG